jgi:hypothetical protein
MTISVKNVKQRWTKKRMMSNTYTIFTGHEIVLYSEGERVGTLSGITWTVPSPRPSFFAASPTARTTHSSSQKFVHGSLILNSDTTTLPRDKDGVIKPLDADISGSGVKKSLAGIHIFRDGDPAKELEQDETYPFIAPKKENK